MGGTENGSSVIRSPSIPVGIICWHGAPNRLHSFSYFSQTEFARLFRTGDFASVNKAGHIQYEGRSDSQIKIRGHRVDLSEIDKHLLEIDGVDKGVVLCSVADKNDPKILAFVALDASSKLREMQIENLLRQKLPEYMRPQVMLIENFPFFVNGKIDRQTLLKMYENGSLNSKKFNSIDSIYRNAIRAFQFGFR